MKSRCGKRTGFSRWPIATDFAARLRERHSRRGGTVAVDVDNGHEISRSLKSLDILCDYRPGAGIRLSPHFYNRDDELDAAIEAIVEIRKTGRMASFHDNPASRDLTGHPSIARTGCAVRLASE